MEWFGGLGKLKKIKKNGMVEMGVANKWLDRRIEMIR